MTLGTTDVMFITRGTAGGVFWFKASRGWSCLLSAAISYATRRVYVAFLLCFNGAMLDKLSVYFRLRWLCSV